ncbi:MAG: radical SAM protein [Novosphingobium sp.]|jgi:radical SAM protein with 4Fe4S-binding SPASM domain|nr:radical SAM protein [Novosphingobium sp.]
MIQEINLSLANICNAKCFFCPRDQYEAKVKIMPILLIKKIIKDIESEEFKGEGHKILHCTIGENGEPTLNPNLIEILRLLRKVSPSIHLFTNFSNLTKDKSETIIKEHLVDAISTNVDGLNAESYKQAKGLDFENFKRNVLDFAELRKSLNDKSIVLFLHIISTENYNKAVLKFFNTMPNKQILPLFAGEAESIKKYWQTIIEPSDAIGVEDNLMWAERKTSPKKQGDFSCTNINRIKTNVFINPAGDWYICCFDAGNEIVLGNIKKQTISEIYKSKKRQDIIKLLEEKKFDEIGYPCNRVDCCQVISNA